MIPQQLKNILTSYTEIETIKGRLGDQIIRYEDKEHNFIYLKSGTGISARSLEQEEFALRWLSNKGITFPQVLGFERSGDTVYLLISGVKGQPPYKLKERDRHELLEISAKALRQLHEIGTEGCEKLDTLQKDLDKIKLHLEMDVIDFDKFVEANNGQTPQEIYEFLVKEKSKFDENSFTHGDFCLPNILINGTEFGFIDMGDCGKGDKYKDLSSMEVSVKRNYGPEWVEIFNKYYDPNLVIDKDKMKYYQFIDQFGYHLNIDKYYEMTKKIKG